MNMMLIILFKLSLFFRRSNGKVAGVIPCIGIALRRIRCFVNSDFNDIKAKVESTFDKFGLVFI
jgi:hypothetical protein